MPTHNAIKPITLDELAATKLSEGLISAIGETTVEQILWSRRQAMNVSDEHVAVPGAQLGSGRTFPVVILGGMVLLPRIPPFPLDVAAKGPSYRAMEAALAVDSEVLLVAVPEARIEGFRGQASQPLPPIGVMARLTGGQQQADERFRVVVEPMSRAMITGCVQHEPFYQATCIPQADPELASAEVEALVDDVKAQVKALLPSLPDATPEAAALVDQITHPGHLADVVVYGPMFSFEERLDVLATLDPMDRLRKVQSGLNT